MCPRMTITPSSFFDFFLLAIYCADIETTNNIAIKTSRQHSDLATHADRKNWLFRRFCTINMLPKRELISSYAHGVLGDGDDLHITGSFEENEENSSTMANASCINTPRASRPGGISVGMEKKDTENSKSDNLQDVEQVGVKLSSKKPMKVMNKIFRQLRQKHRQHLLKLCQQPAVFRSSISTINEYQEIIEDENENDHQHEEEAITRIDDSMTIVSQRSTRNNIRTGRSMLVSQKAEVFGRPSAAQAKWDISSSFSSDSTNYRNILRRQKSLTLDNSSCDGLSVLTEDTSLYRSFSKMDHLSFRQHPMFIDATTYRIEEDTDESESSSDNESEGNDISPDSDGIECGYDFRQLPSFDENNNTESTPDNNSNSYWHLDNKEEEEVTHTPVDIRQRVFSDSDVIFERQRHVANGYSGIDLPSSSTKSSFSANQEPFQKSLESHRRSSSSPTSNTESFDRSFEAFNTHHGSVYLPHLDLYDDTWAESKRRTYSDSCIQRTPVNQTFESPLWGDMNDKKKLLVQNGSLLDGEFEPTICRPKRSNNRLSLEARFGDWRRQPQHTLGFDEQSSFSNPTISMTYSDSIVREKSISETPLKYPRNQSLLDFDNQEDSEGLFGTSELGSSPMASHARRLTTTLLSNKRRSPSTKEVVEYTAHTIGPASSSVLATLSPTNHATGGMLSAGKNHVMPSKYSSVRQSSSPRTLNTTSMIVTALRPAPALTQPMLPSPSPASIANQGSDNYYWNQDPGNVEICEVQQQQVGIIRAWSSESFDDMLF
jgi:hypothetical protein